MENKQVAVQESTSSSSGGGAESVQVIEKNSGGPATSFSLNLSSDDDSASSNASAPSPVPDAAGNTGSASSADDSPLSFSSISHNNHQKTTLYARESNHSSAYSESSSSTNADIEESSSGSTSIELSLSGFSYETTSKSKSQFSYIAESEYSSNPPTNPDGSPGSKSESRSLHVIETLNESESKFGFAFGSEGLSFTNEYSSNETVSDVSEHKGEWETWTLVYPELDSSAMDANYAPPPPVWVQGPNLTDGNNTNIQYNYGGDLEDGFEGSFTETHHYWMDFLNDDGTVDHYEYTETVQETFPNSNDSDGVGADGADGGNSSGGDGGTASGNQMTGFNEGDGASNGNSPSGSLGVIGTISTPLGLPNGWSVAESTGFVYDTDGNLSGMMVDGVLVWPKDWLTPQQVGQQPGLKYPAHVLGHFYRHPIQIVGDDATALAGIIGRIHQTMQDFYENKVRTGQAQNHCFQYRDSILFATENGRSIPRDPALRHPRFTLIDGGVRNWWGPLYLAPQGIEPNGISDGGIFIIDNKTGDILYVHADPSIWGSFSFIVERFNLGQYPLSQPPIGHVYVD